MAKRKYILATSKHRPDGKATVWVLADREFTPDEAAKKSADVVNNVMRIPACKDIGAGYNERFIQAEKIGEKSVALEVTPRELEFIVPPKCVRHIVDYMQKKWKGKWTEENPWE